MAEEKAVVAEELASMSHSDVYILDANLIIGYLLNDIPGWNGWVDEHIKQGKKLYVLPMTFEEIVNRNPKLPEGFEILIAEDCVPQHILDIAYEKVVERLGIQGKMRLKLKIDIEMVVLAGYFAASASAEQISDEEILGDRVVLASNSFNLIKRVLRTEEKRAIMEQIIDDYGFEHLITIRFISKEETWYDFF